MIVDEWNDRVPGCGGSYLLPSIAAPCLLSLDCVYVFFFSGPRGHVFTQARRCLTYYRRSSPCLCGIRYVCSFLQRPLPLLNKETVQEMVRTARRIGLIKGPQVVICEKKFFCSLNFFCEKFPIWALFYSQYVNSLVFSKYFVQLFSSEHYVYLNICASTIDNLSVRLNPNVV